MTKTTPELLEAAALALCLGLIAPWLGGRLYSLGTDGFGRSDNRAELRRFFHVGQEEKLRLGRAA